MNAHPPRRARCPVCGNAIQGEFEPCARCATPHHPECLAYVGRCSIYGCADQPTLPALLAARAVAPVPPPLKLTWWASTIAFSALAMPLAQAGRWWFHWSELTVFLVGVALASVLARLAVACVRPRAVEPSKQLEVVRSGDPERSRRLLALAACAAAPMVFALAASWGWFARQIPSFSFLIAMGLVLDRAVRWVPVRVQRLVVIPALAIAAGSLAYAAPNRVFAFGAVFGAAAASVRAVANGLWPLVGPGLTGRELAAARTELAPWNPEGRARAATIASSTTITLYLAGYLHTPGGYPLLGHVAFVACMLLPVLASADTARGWLRAWSLERRIRRSPAAAE